MSDSQHLSDSQHPSRRQRVIELLSRSCMLALVIVCIWPPGPASADQVVGAETVSSPPSWAAAGRYQSPLRGRTVVVRAFSGEVGKYAAGHRGVDFDAPPGATVLSAQSGVVLFAGGVAGHGVVTVRHPDGIVTEYEPIRPTVTRGMTIGKGAVIGTVVGVHRGCEKPCLHWGAKHGERYLDPLGLLLRLGVIRLLPET